MEAFRDVLLQLVKKNRWLFLILIATLPVGTFGYTILSIRGAKERIFVDKIVFSTYFEINFSDS